MNCNCPRSSYGIKHTPECYDALTAELAAAKAIIARDDTTESFKCSECGAWHVRKPTAPEREAK